MQIPDYQTLMLPLLMQLQGGRELAMRDIVAELGKEFNLSPSQMTELLPSGRQPIFANRAHWARTYLVKAGLLTSPRRGYVSITAEGTKVIENPPQKIDVTFLNSFPSFVEFRTASTEGAKTIIETGESRSLTPIEQMSAAYSETRAELAAELLNIVVNSSPSFFELLVVDLMIAMGYGWDKELAGQTTGTSADEGIDGLIYEDRLGLEVVYLQAKRWQSSVGRPLVQAFAGALQGQKASKGVMITTSTFSREAHDYAQKIGTRIVLIDGKQLAEYMIDFNVGVSPGVVYEIKKLDTDYFSES